MAKTVKHDNYRVVIEPRRLGDFGCISMSDRMVCRDEADRLRQYKERCLDIAADVKRHVNNVGRVDIEFDSMPVCEHCGSEWTEEGYEYNGGCCEKDQATQDEREAATDRWSR